MVGGKDRVGVEVRVGGWGSVSGQVSRVRAESNTPSAAQSMVAPHLVRVRVRVRVRANLRGAWQGGAPPAHYKPQNKWTNPDIG